MKNPLSVKRGGDSRAVSRRQFLAGCAACGAGVACGGRSLTRLVAGEPQATPAGGGSKPKVRLVFTYVPSTAPIWPNIGYDFEAKKRQILEGLARECPNVQFAAADVHNADQAKKLVEEDRDKGYDAYLVYMLGIWTGAPQVIAGAGKPTVFVDNLYGGSGEWLIANAASRRAKRPVVGVSTAKFDDVGGVVRCFEVLGQPGKTADDFLAAAEAARRRGFRTPGDLSVKEDKVRLTDVGKVLEKLKASKIVVVGNNPTGLIQAIKESFGTTVVPVDFPELHGAFQKADRKEAERWADQWTCEAERVIEPSHEEIVKSGAMHVAMCELLKKHEAQAMSINCLGGFYGNHLQAYPCLGFCQLNNDGLVGACESDLVSTITMLAVGYLSGRPGYISDPVIDTSRNHIIYAHCVAPSKVFGPDGASNPFHIRSHSEDRRGASIRSLMPLGYMTSTMELHPMRREVIFHAAKAVDNIDDDMACRTKLAAEPRGDLDKLMTYWDQWGWHRVTFYGDLKAPVEELAKALSFKVVEEA